MHRTIARVALLSLALAVGCAAPSLEQRRQNAAEMTPSPLIKRLQRMTGEMERGEESFERKLRYLLWVN